ncbi:hypothetical protein FEM48_Zijuj04G0167600 [Ziziphus jujuba var. spinosa]|uniref:Disease resistance protein RPS4B/Roq1-like leucine-rich repeats domain-containing protein n=1 Tax=Ziziphus jujuba var. spinosa TaxID=714518 RepID=A0A978VL06_ZIZJJ|nr:hypothetical protein FEM48_Zijuj04G0167600 [Ziziphus jujuba var. spinosa]
MLLVFYASSKADIFVENYRMGTNAIEGIKLELPEPKTLYLSAKAFENMKRLRLLIFRNVVISTAVEDLPTQLRYIDWPGYQFPTLPFNPGPKQLVILNMPHSHIHRLGEGFKVHSLCSRKFRFCSSFVLLFCCNLSILPSSLRPKSLRTLNFANCSRLESFPNIFPEMKNLRKLYLCATSVKELHPSIQHLVGLEVLDLAYCKKLMHIPTSVYKLHNLEHLGLGGCSNLSLFPKSMASSGTYKHLQFAELLPIVFQMLPESCLDCPFPKLKFLDLQNCNLSEVDFLMTPNGFHNLQMLNLAENKFASLPSFVQLSKLSNLNLTKCELLRDIPELPQSLRDLDVSDCKLLLEINGNEKRYCQALRNETPVTSEDMQQTLSSSDADDHLSQSRGTISDKGKGFAG